MSNFNALMVAVDAASRKRDSARKVLQDALATQRSAQNQLEQIEGYAREIEGRWGMQADMAVKPEVMYHHYQFMGRLSHASSLQTKVVTDQAGRVEVARRALLEAELRVTSLRKVLDKRLSEQEQLAVRREQKQTDERAALQYRNVNQSSENTEY